MQPVYLFTLASQHERWATVRQAALTSNIANANTQGYTAVDIQPFSAVLDDTAQVTLARTEPGHLSASGESGDRGGARLADEGRPTSRSPSTSS